MHASRAAIRPVALRGRADPARVLRPLVDGVPHAVPQAADAPLRPHRAGAHRPGVRHRGVPDDALVSRATRSAIGRSCCSGRSRSSSASSSSRRASWRSSSRSRTSAASKPPICPSRTRRGDPRRVLRSLRDPEIPAPQPRAASAHPPLRPAPARAHPRGGPVSSMLEIGIGEGFLSGYLSEKLPTVRFCGVDASATGTRATAAPLPEDRDARRRCLRSLGPQRPVRSRALRRGPRAPRRAGPSARRDRRAAAASRRAHRAARAVLPPEQPGERRKRHAMGQRSRSTCSISARARSGSSCRRGSTS